MRTITITLLFFVQLTFAQNNNSLKVKCLDLINPDTTILYTNIHNHIKIYYENSNDNDFTVSIIGGTIKKTDSVFVVEVNDFNRVTLLVLRNNSITNTPDKIYFFINNFQPLAPSLSNTMGGHVKQKNLINEEKITINQPKNKFLKNNFIIEGFTLTYSDSEFTKDFTSNSEFLTIEQRNAIKSFQKGQKFYIENVKVKDKEGKTLPVENAAFIIDE